MSRNELRAPWGTSTPRCTTMFPSHRESCWCRASFSEQVLDGLAPSCHTPNRGRCTPSRCRLPSKEWECTPDECRQLSTPTLESYQQSSNRPRFQSREGWTWDINFLLGRALHWWVFWWRQEFHSRQSEGPILVEFRRYRLKDKYFWDRKRSCRERVSVLV